MIIDNDSYQSILGFFRRGGGKFCVVTYNEKNRPCLEKQPTDDLATAKEAAFKAIDGGARTELYQRNGDDVWALVYSR